MYTNNNKSLRLHLIQYKTICTVTSLQLNERNLFSHSPSSIALVKVKIANVPPTHLVCVLAVLVADATEQIHPEHQTEMYN